MRYQIVRNYQHWTPDQDSRLVGLIKEKASPMAMMKALGRSYASVSSRIQKLKKEQRV